MRFKVLKRLSLSRDGINVKHHAEGEILEDVPENLVKGLTEAGFLGEPDLLDGSTITPSAHLDAGAPFTGLVNDKVVLGPDWRDLHHTKLILLAKELDPSVTKKNDAVAVLGAYEAAAKAAADDDI